jgi:hypothetical protein
MEPYKRNKIEFIKNNFILHKNMQSDICMMMHDVKSTRKIK